MENIIFKVFLTIILGALVLALIWWMVPDLSQNIPTDALKI